jgi:hypothetical protein
VADIAWSDVTAVDAALSAVSAGAQTMFLAEANALYASAFDGTSGPRYKLARVYLAAHRGRVSLESASGAAGPVVSKTIGGMSKTYAAPTSGDSDDLDLTRWGRAYRDLCRTSPRARLGYRP